MLDWFARIPSLVKIGFGLAGYLVSAFSGRLPEGFQDVGLWVGFAVGTLAVVGLMLHQAQVWRGGKKVTPQDVIYLGVVGAFIFTLVAIGGMVWQHYSPPTISQRTEIATPSSIVATAETKPSKPTRHLSSKDKDNIVNALNELSAVTEKRLRKMMDKVAEAIATWRNSPANVRTAFIPEMQKTLTAAGAEAQSIAKYVRDTWLQENLDYRDELAMVLTAGGEQQAMGLVENFSGEAADFNTAMDAYRKLVDENSTLEQQESAYQLGKPASDKFQKSVEELRAYTNNLAYWIKRTRDEL